MKTISSRLVMIIFFAGTVFAGQIFGRVENAGRAVSDAQVEIVCGNNTSSVRTDRNGSYRINVATTGRCTIKVTSNNISYSSSVYSYSNPVRYDFELQQRQGRPFLKRK